MCPTGWACPVNSPKAACPTGSYATAGATSCSTCAANTYADVAGSSSCTQCPLNSLAGVGSTSKSACNCNAGYYRDIDFNCIACPAGYKCTGNNLMTACIPGTASIVGQSTCTACTAGSYSDTYAMQSCLTCPAGTTVIMTSEVVLGNGGGDRTNHPTDSGFLYIQRKPLPSNANYTKWSFYAFQTCTVTPVIAEAVGAVGNTAYGTISFIVTTVGTTRSVPTAGSYTYDFSQGQIMKTKTISAAGGGLYFNQNYIGWYFQGAACIPYDNAALEALPSSEYIVQSAAYTQLDPATQNTIINFARSCGTDSMQQCSTGTTSVFEGATSNVNANDGNRETGWVGNPMSNWLRVDFGQARNVISGTVWNKQDMCRESTRLSLTMCYDRLSKFHIYVGNDASNYLNNQLCYTDSGTNISNPMYGYSQNFSCVASGRYAWLQKDEVTYTSIGEIEFYGYRGPQTFTDTFSTRQNTRYSVSLTSVVTASVVSSAPASTDIFNCSCGSTLRQLTDGNCQGLCIDGKYMAKDTDQFCTTCTQGSFCTKSVRTPCPTDTSSLAGAAQCITCVGPNTHTDLSLAMCGLKTCPAATPVAISGTSWKALGRITLGLGGNGVIPSTPWFAAYKCLGLVLNATADRPVSLVSQTLTVTPNQSYALRFKVVCTGTQCGAGFTVTRDGATLYTSNTVSRSWTEAATPYFTTTGTSVTIQFRGQMVTSSCTLWLAQVELVDLGQWSYSSISALRLQNGVFLPTRFSAAYAESQQVVPMQITGVAHIQQSSAVLANYKYELRYWMQGTVEALAFNGSDWLVMDLQAPIDAVAGWTQRVFHVTPSATELKVRLIGPGTIAPPSLTLHTDPSTRPCANCLPGYWCKGATMNKCPLNTDSTAGSSLQTDCFCSPGYYGQVQLGVNYGYSPCSICPMNFYCNGGNQMAPCPAGTKSQPGSAIAGCTPCPAGEFCENGQVGTCPPNSYAPSGSNDIGDCGCMPGFYGTMGSCAQCEPGFHCPGGANKFPCTANAVSPPGSTDSLQCFCDRGYYGVNNTECQVCPEKSWCWTGVSNDCPVNTWSPTLSSFQVNCTCASGYTGPDGGPCVACSQGYYKPELGPGACTACPVGTSSTATAAQSASTCAMCNRGNFNPYTGQSACLACDAGTSTGSFGSVNCTTCPAGGWSAAGAASCVPCVGGTYSAVAAATNAGTCQPCPTGAWSASSSLACNECGACSYWSWPMRVTATLSGSPALMTSVNTNLQSFMTLASSTEAIVSEGSALHRMDIATGATTNLNYPAVESLSYSHIEAARDRGSLYLVQTSVYRVSLPALELQNQYLANNPMGVVEGLDGTSLWVTQSDGLARFQLVTENLASVTPYPSGLTSVTASPCTHASYPNFVFLAGKAASGSFGFRKFQVSTGTWGVVSATLASLNKCTFTPDGNFAVLTAITGTWLYSMTEGTFVKLYTGQINGVVVDPLSRFLLLARQQVGIYKQAVVIQDARNCGPGLFSVSGGLSSAAQCDTCPAGSLCPGGANITQCAPGSFSASAGLRTQGQCTTCPAGRFCTGGTASQLCPLGSYSLAQSVTRVVDCGLCPAGFYCPNTTAIVACPSNTFSPSGSSDLSSCTCNAGYKCEVTKVVHAEVTLPISIVDFEALRQAYIEAVAAAAGVDPSQVVIVSVTSSAPGGRRLLSAREYAEVHTSIYGSRHIAQPHLALATLQRHLEGRGLPRHESNLKITLHHEVSHSIKARADY